MTDLSTHLTTLLAEAEKATPGLIQDLLREAEELECQGEECEMHCALIDIAENFKLKLSKVPALIKALQRAVGFIGSKCPGVGSKHECEYCETFSEISALMLGVTE